MLFYSYTFDIDILARWETDRELDRYELPFGDMHFLYLDGGGQCPFVQGFNVVSVRQLQIA